MVFGFLFLAGVFLAGCGKSVSDFPSGGEVTGGGSVRSEVTVSVVGEATKSVMSFPDISGGIRDIQVFVFDGNRLDGWRKLSEDVSSTTVLISPGKRTIWVVLNVDEDIHARYSSEEHEMTYSDFMTYMVDLGENEPDALVMTGSTEAELSAGKEVTVSVKRCVSRICLDTVSASFRRDKEGAVVTLKGIYVINLVGEYSFATLRVPDVWYNMLGNFNPELGDIVCDMFNDEDVVVMNNVYARGVNIIREDEAYVDADGGDYTLAEGVSLSGDMSVHGNWVYYVFPNDYDELYSDEWSPRRSMLVLEASVLCPDGTVRTGYYPVSLPIIERNKTYVIEDMKLLHYPVEKPYQQMKITDVVFDIRVGDWDDEFLGEEGKVIL